MSIIKNFFERSAPQKALCITALVLGSPAASFVWFNSFAIFPSDRR
jgi:hypothetical protein